MSWLFPKTLLRRTPARASGKPSALLYVNPWPLDFVRSTVRTGGSQEQLLPIRQPEVPAVGPVRSVLGLIPFHDNLVPHLERIFGDTAPQQDVRATGFD